MSADLNDLTDSLNSYLLLLTTTPASQDLLAKSRHGWIIAICLDGVTPTQTTHEKTEIMNAANVISLIRLFSLSIRKKIICSVSIRVLSVFFCSAIANWDFEASSVDWFVELHFHI